jgi:hypothetical protein
LIDQGEIEILPLDATHRRFHSRASVDFDTLSLERFSMLAEGFDVFVKDQYLAPDGHRASLLYQFSHLLSHVCFLQDAGSIAGAPIQMLLCDLNHALKELIVVAIPVKSGERPRVVAP